MAGRAGPNIAVMMPTHGRLAMDRLVTFGRFYQSHLAVQSA
jgi:hypothetical protein